MTLLALLSGVETVEVSGDTSMEISDIIYDSRKVVPDSVYVALAGVRSDGHDYLIEGRGGGSGSGKSGKSRIFAFNARKAAAGYSGVCGGNPQGARPSFRQLF